MEERVNNDNIGVQTINARRKNEVASNSAHPTIPSAANPIQQEPSEKLQNMGTRDGGNFMPDNALGVLRASDAGLSQFEAFNALRIKVNLAMLIMRQAFQQLGKRALRTVPAINEG